MPCLFLCHTSGLKLFPGGSALLRLSSNAGLHSSYLFQTSTNTGPLPSSNAGMYPSSNAGLCPSSNTGLYPSSNARLYPRCHKSPWFKCQKCQKCPLWSHPLTPELYAGLLPRWCTTPTVGRFLSIFLLVRFILCQDI